MSSHPPNFPNHVSVAASTNTAALRTRRGCSSSVTGAILFAFAVFVGLDPWALHMGRTLDPCSNLARHRQAIDQWCQVWTFHGGELIHAESRAQHQR